MKQDVSNMQDQQTKAVKSDKDLADKIEDYQKTNEADQKSTQAQLAQVLTLVSSMYAKAPATKSNTPTEGGDK